LDEFYPCFSQGGEFRAALGCKGKIPLGFVSFFLESYDQGMSGNETGNGWFAHVI